MKKKAFPKIGNGKGMKKSIPIIRERESGAFILGNGGEREFPLTPGLGLLTARKLSEFRICIFGGKLFEQKAIREWSNIE